jgi:hypothetical protein
MSVENGGRIELRLGAWSAESAEYEANLQTAHSRWRATARVGALAAGKVEFGAWRADSDDADAPSAPPPWLSDDARAALKAALRTSQAEGRWPRRIARWRAEPLD